MPLSRCYPLLLLLFPLTALSAPPPDSLDRDYADQLPRIAPRSPEEAAASFQVRPDLEVQLVASEPEVRDPVALDFDEFGHMYVVQMQGYSEQAEEHLGSVRRLTDTDGDGYFETAETFVDGLSWPTSVCCYAGGIFVAAAPDILYFRDTDDDGRADSREVVYTGFGRENVQALLNNLQWGWDNRIHGATSRNPAVVSQPGSSERIDLRGRDFSFDPETRVMRTETGGGQHGMTFDACGNKYFCSNSDHIRLVLCPDRYLARNPRLAATETTRSIAADGPAATVYRASPVEPWRVVRTRLRVQGLVSGPIEGGGRPAGYFTSATGLLMYTGDGLPGAYRGRAMVGDVGSNLVHQKEIQWDGTTAVARRVDEETELLRSTDIWFRPVQLANGPDGALYVLDMYREVIEHPWSLPPVIKQHLDLTSGRDRGRIWRITSRGQVARPRPLPGSVDDDALIDMLGHSNGWHRLTASRLLCSRGRQAPEAWATRLRAFLERSPGVGRIHALAVLQHLGQLAWADVQIALGDPSPWVRARAIELSESLPADGAECLLVVTSDPDIRVRRQLAFTIGSRPRYLARAPFVQLALADGADPSMRQALLTSAHPAQLDYLSELLRSGAPDQLAAAQPLLVELAREGAAAEPRELVRFLATLEACFPRIPEIADQVLAVVWRESRGRGEAWNGAVGETIGRRLASLRRRLVRQALDGDLEIARRLEAVQGLALLDADPLETVLDGLLRPAEPVELQRAALEAVGELADPRVAQVLMEHLAELTPAVRRQALGVVMGRPEWIEVLLGAVERGELPPGELDPAMRQALREHPRAALRKRAAELLDDPAPALPIDDRLGRVLALEADPRAGEAVFRQHCAVCHEGDAQRPALAPPLDAIRARGAPTVLANVLDPNREVDPRYIRYTVLVADGRVLSGMIASESASSIQLVTADGARHDLVRAEIDELRRSGSSLMPDGFGQMLTDQQLADIVAYVIDDLADPSRPDKEPAK